MLNLEYGRAAFAVSLLKRGGETIHWGAKWNSTAINLYNKYMKDQQTKNPKISGRFPYAVAELFKPYKLKNHHDQKSFVDCSVSQIVDILKKELNYVSKQQNGELILKDCEKYLDELANGINNSRCEKKIRLDDFVNLFLTGVFIKRERGE